MTEILDHLLDIRVDLAFGADLEANPGTWEWTTVSGRAPHGSLELTGGADAVTTPDQPAFNITGDFTATVFGVTTDDWSSTGTGHLAGQMDGAAGWRFSVNDFNISLNIGGPVLKTIPWTPPADGVPVSLRVDYDAASGVATFLQSSGVGWDLIGSAGSPSTFTHAAVPLTVGLVATGNAFPGTIDRFELWDGGLGGTLVASPDFYQQPTGTAPFEDAQGNLWSFGGAAQIAEVPGFKGDLLAQTVAINRGRADESSQAAPSRVSFELDNLTGDYTPTNPLSIYYPNVRRGTPCHVLVEGRTRFVGQVDSWEPSWPLGDLSGPTSPGESRMLVSASAFTRRLAQGEVATSALYQAIMQVVDDPALSSHVFAYWPLEDGSEATTGSSPMPGVGPFVPGGGFDFAGDSSLPASKPLLAASGGFGFDTALPQQQAVGRWAVEFDCFMSDHLGDTTSFMTVLTTSGGINRFELCATAADQWRVRIFNDSGALSEDLTFPMNAPAGFGGSFIGHWFRMRLTITSPPSGTIALAWAAAEIPGDVHQASTASTVSASSVTRLQALYGIPSSGTVAYGHVVVHDADPSLPSPLIGVEANSAWVGEQAADRYQRLAAENNVPVMVDPGDSVEMGPQLVNTITSLLQECVDADGAVAIDAVDDWALRFRPRVSMYNQTPSLVLDAAKNQIANPFQPVLDDQRFTNDVTANRTGAGSARVEDEPSILADGRYPTSLTINLADDTELFAAAGWRLHLGLSNGDMRYPQVSAELTIATENIPDWLRLRVGDLIRVINLPPQHPIPTVDLIVQGSNERVSPPRWAFMLNCTPGSPWTVGQIQDPLADPPQIGGIRIGTDGSELVSAVDETATSLTVATTAGNPWTTEAGDVLPFDIAIGGERMTVTLVTGATSPQTFTVTRSVNQIVKPHAAGAAVQLANPCVIAW